MLICSGLCEYYETYPAFNRWRTYQTHKQCTRCDHVVPKDEFPDPHCYCCNAKYRNKYPVSSITRRIARYRKRKRDEQKIIQS
jgi:hypothetical protein